MDAASIYKRRAMESATPIGLIVLLYEGILTGLRRAITIMEEGRDAARIESRTLALNRVLSIVGELKSVLDYERGGEAAVRFARFYGLAEQRILEASVRQDPEPLRELLAPFTNVQAAWRQADTLPQGAANVAAFAEAADSIRVPGAELESLPTGGRSSWQA